MKCGTVPNQVKKSGDNYSRPMRLHQPSMNELGRIAQSLREKEYNPICDLELVLRTMAKLTMV
jgi:hypothetical protein